MVNLSRNPVEGGSIVVRLSFVDSAGTYYEPIEDSVSYTLLAQKNTRNTWEVVNHRRDVVLESRSVIDIVLQGDDLALLPDCSTKRRVIVNWYYTRNGEETLGREMFDFEVTPLPTLAE